MRVKDLINILGQFDGERRVVIQAVNDLYKPTNIRPLTTEEHISNATPVDYGDIIIQAIAE